jgi:hypothetical protein
MLQTVKSLLPLKICVEVFIYFKQFVKKSIFKLVDGKISNLSSPTLQATTESKANN